MAILALAGPTGEQGGFGSSIYDADEADNASRFIGLLSSRGAASASCWTRQRWRQRAFSPRMIMRFLRSLEPSSSIERCRVSRSPP
jgi:hypothetical protein